VFGSLCPFRSLLMAVPAGPSVLTSVPQINNHIGSFCAVT